MFKHVAAAAAISVGVLSSSTVHADAPVEWGQAGDTPFLRFEGGDAAIVYLHGWSMNQTPDDLLGAFAVAAPFTALTAAGYDVYVPFHGSDWGANIAAVDDIQAQLELDGHDPDELLIYGNSAGATTALNWAAANPDELGAMYLTTPVFSLGDLHERDTPENWAAPSMTASIDEALGDDLARFDPYQNPARVAVVADRVAVFGSRDDEVVNWSMLEPWCLLLGITLQPSSLEGQAGGGHIFWMQQPTWSESNVIDWFRSLS